MDEYPLYAVLVTPDGLPSGPADTLVMLLVLDDVTFWDNVIVIVFITQLGSSRGKGLLVGNQEIRNPSTDSLPSTTLAGVVVSVIP